MANLQDWTEPGMKLATRCIGSAKSVILGEELDLHIANLILFKANVKNAYGWESVCVSVWKWLRIGGC